MRGVAGRLRDEAQDLGPGDLEAMARRLLAEPGARGGAGYGVVTFGVFAFDLDAGRLSRRGNVVGLTIPERAILHHLIAHRDRHVPVVELIDVAWPSGRGHASNVRSAVGVLRQHLRNGGLGDAIVSQRLAGYRFAAAVEARSGDDPSAVG